MKKKLIVQQTNLHSLIFIAFIGLFTTNLSAQIVLGTGNLSTRSVSCGSSTSFTDDGTNDGLYLDDAARKDTIILCPSTSGRQIKVSFNSFDIASGDRLLVYEGDLNRNPTTVFQSASGVGASAAFGGWVQADCDPSINPTGCLTFVLETNGDNGKGTGWEAIVTCEGSGISVQCPSNISVTDNCNSLDGMVSVTIPKPTFTTCEGTANAMVSITSSCSAITGGTVLADGGTLGTFTIPLGSYSITATSVADNSKTCTYFVIADQPNISCNDNLTSSIGFGCTASISVDDIIENPCVGSGTTYEISINLGSKAGTRTATVDGSSISSLNANRLELASSDFDCGSEYPVEITRTVSFASCGGGTSLSTSCTGSIRFVDNTAPSIFVTAPTLTTCGNLTEAELKRQLTINVTDNCDVRDTLVSVGAFPSNFCSNNLSVRVTVTAVDFCGNSNSETLDVAIIRPTTFFPPSDTVLNCGAGTAPSVTGYPVLDTDGDGVGDLAIIDNTCNFVPIFTDQVVTANNSRTTKIFRTWQIEDWCDQAVPVTLPVQVIEVLDTGKPIINCPSGNQQGTQNNPYSVNVNSSNCTGSISLTPPSATDDCGGNVTVSLDVAVNISHRTTFNNLNNLPIGDYFAVYFGRDETGNRSDSCKVYFSVKDNTVPTITVVAIDECLVSTNCEESKSFSIIANDCSSTESLSSSYEFIEEGTVKLSGQGTNFSATVSNKNYEVKWTVNDNDGNTASETVAYTFKDCTKPSPSFLEGLVVLIDDNKEAVVWASDLNQESTDNCSPAIKLEMRIYHPSLTIDKPQNDADAATILALPFNIKFSCEDFGMQYVDLYVIDEAGNWDYSTVFIYIQDDNKACEVVPHNIAGSILSTSNVPISGVEVTAKSTEVLFEQTVTTNDSGIFKLDLPIDIEYSISFTKKDIPNNGITTFDLILVSKHILGTNPFEANWQYLAADMNKSGSITAFDMVTMRQIILGINEGNYPDNPWRYIPLSEEFTSSNGDIDIPLTEETIIINLTEGIPTLDFFAIKMGDINGSVRGEDFVAAEERNNNPLILNLKNQYVESGETVNVAIPATSLKDIQSLQFGLAFDGLTLLEIENGQGQNQHIAQKNDQEVVVSWDKYSAAKNKAANLFTLKFSVEKTGYLNESIRLSNSILTEAVNEKEEFSKVALNFESIATNNLKLYQNTPNPFTESTKIGFDLAQKSEVLLEIFNLQGALLTQIKGTFEKGYHELPIQQSTLKGNGVLLYQLTTPTEIASKKMMLLD